MSGPVERPVGSVIILVKDYGLFFVVFVIFKELVFLACPSADYFHRGHELFGKATFPMVSVVESVRYSATGPWVLSQEVGSIYKQKGMFKRVPGSSERASYL